MVNDKVKNSCFECGNTKIFTDHVRGEETCASCGLVINDNAIYFEKRIFNYARRKDMTNRGVYRRYLQSDRKRNSELDRLCSQIRIPYNVRNLAFRIYSRITGILATADRDLLVAASLYTAIRHERLPRVMREIVIHTRFDQKEVAKCYNQICTELDLKITPQKPTEYVVRVLKELNLPVSLSKSIHRDMINYRKAGIHTGKNPFAFAASSVYTSSRDQYNIRSSDVARIAFTSVKTIRSRYREMSEL